MRTGALLPCLSSGRNSFVFKWPLTRSFCTPTSPSDLVGPTLYIIDGTALLYKSFYGLGKQKYYANLVTNTLHGSDATPPGQPCGAVAAMASSFTQFCRKVQPSHVVVVFDAGRKTFRNRLYPRYKQQRAETPSALAVQFPMAKRVLEELGAHCMQKADVEADDVMASVGSWAHQQGMNVVHISADKDMWQLLKPGVYISDISAKVFVTEEIVMQKYGLPPKALPQYFALVGDSADNIPGVKGVGPKTALALIREFKTLECLYATVEILTTCQFVNNAEEVELGEPGSDALRRMQQALVAVRCNPSKVLQKLAASTREEVLLFRTLIELREDLGSSALRLEQLLLGSEVEMTHEWNHANANALSLLQFNGEKHTARVFLQDFTVCGTMVSCLRALHYSRAEEEEAGREASL